MAAVTFIQGCRNIVRDRRGGSAPAKIKKHLLLPPQSTPKMKTKHARFHYRNYLYSTNTTHCLGHTNLFFLFLQVKWRVTARVVRIRDATLSTHAESYRTLLFAFLFIDEAVQ